jgi:hypothetical protein
MISICGIDPGKQGGLAFKDGNKVQAVSFTKLTKPEIAHTLLAFMPDKVYLEKAQPMRKLWEFHMSLLRQEHGKQL